MKTLAFATALLAAAPAAADPFTLMIWETPEELALRTDTTEAGQAYWGGYMAFAQEAGAAGLLRGGSALMTDRGSIVTLGAAPPARGPLRLGGRFQIDVPDLETAQDWAAKSPSAASASAEVRPLMPMNG